MQVRFLPSPPKNFERRNSLCIRSYFITCSCEKIFKLTETQFDDFDCGMMGFLKCDCGQIIMPNCKDRGLKIEEKEVEGEDPGWT